MIRESFQDTSNWVKNKPEPGSVCQLEQKNKKKRQIKNIYLVKQSNEKCAGKIVSVYNKESYLIIPKQDITPFLNCGGKSSQPAGRD